MGEIGHGSISRLSMENANIEVIDLSNKTPEEARTALEKVYPRQKEKPFKYEIKAFEPMTTFFDLRPKKPRYNPKTNKTKYF